MPCSDKAEAARASNEAVRQAERERDIAENEVFEAEEVIKDACKILGNPISCVIAHTLLAEAVKRFNEAILKHDSAVEHSDDANYQYDKCLRKCLYMTPI